jgi:hypothetical protein
MRPNYPKLLDERPKGLARYRWDMLVFGIRNHLDQLRYFRRTLAAIMQSSL